MDKGLTGLADKQIPAGADQNIVLLQSQELAQAQLIYKFTIPLARYLLPVLALILVGAVLISGRRARVVFGIGILLAASREEAEAFVAAESTLRDHLAQQLGAQVSTIEAVLADPSIDVVAITSPTSTHSDLITRAAAAIRSADSMSSVISPGSGTTRR